MTSTTFLFLFAQIQVSGPNQFNGFLFLAYAVMGAIALGYIISLGVRQRNLRRDIQLLEKILQEDD